MNKLSVIMPAYNNPDIDTNLNAATEILKKIYPNYELIVVDDGSKYPLSKKIEKINDPRIIFKTYKKNQGKGYAIRHGFKFASGDYIVFLDSGRDLNPVQINNFLQIMKEKNSDIVIGSKKHRLSEVNYPLFRRFMSWGYQKMNYLLFNLNVKDTQVGLKLFKRKPLEKIIPKLIVKRFAFDLELLIVANKFNYKIVEAPISLNYKFKSTINIKSVFFIILDTFAIFYRLKLLGYYND